MRKKTSKIIYIATIIYLIIASLSCSGNDPVSAALKGDTKLKDGDPVPFLLYQNKPNPFNPSTSISFVVVQSMHLTLKIYTEDWQAVTTLFDKDVILQSSAQPSAYPHYQVEFDAKDKASGLYYYVLEGGGYTQIRTMRLIK